MGNTEVNNEETKNNNNDEKEVDKEDEEYDDDEEEEEEEDKSTPLANYEYAKGIPSSLSLSKSAIESLVRWYCREAGVRSLAKYIDQITRKLALQYVAEQLENGTELNEKSTRKNSIQYNPETEFEQYNNWEVNEHNLKDYVGKQIFTSDRLYDKDPLPNGIVMGLAYTSMGGSALYIETQGIRRGIIAQSSNSSSNDNGGGGGSSGGGSRGTIKVTGQLGSVMKESAEISYTCARAKLADLMMNDDDDDDDDDDKENNNNNKKNKKKTTHFYFDHNDIHLHVPEGATPKDGPSAGVTMVTSMLSLALGKSVRNDLAMTGEISLTGKVLPVGGIKEKIMAAKRAGIQCVILPLQNQRDYDEIPSYLKENLEVHFVDDYDKVYDIAFQNNPTTAEEEENPNAPSSSSSSTY